MIRMGKSIHHKWVKAIQYIPTPCDKATRVGRLCAPVALSVVVSFVHVNVNVENVIIF